MCNEDLIKMLGLDGKPVDSDKLDEQLYWSEPHEGTMEDVEITSTVLKVDEWDLAQGERLEHHCLLSNGVGPVRHQQMADFFAAAYHQQPEVAGQCEDKIRQDYLTTLMETPDYKVLHNSTQSNLLASDMAAITFAREFAKLREEEKPDEIACIKAAGKALKQAQQEVDDLEDMQRGLGLGGEGSGKMSTEQVAKLFKKVKNDKVLKRICELAGRYRRAAQAKQRQKVSHGYDEMIGVMLDGDVGRLVPSELAMLADPIFELDAMRRIVERQAMCREYRGVERVAKGPIIVCVDESGSMHGEPVCNCKAFCLAMTWIAGVQNRPCLLVSYSGSTQLRIVELLPGKWNHSELVDWLKHFFGGSTDMDVPFEMVPKMPFSGKHKGKVDMVVLTDAICNVPDPMAKKFNDWKAEYKCRCTGIVIGQSSTGELGKCCDEIHQVSAISVDCDPVQKAFAI